MYQKPCRLTRADKCYFGGGGPDIPQRSLTGEFGQIFKQAWPTALKAFGKFVQGQPLLQESQDFALSNLRNVGDLINPLQSVYTNYIAPVLARGGALTDEQTRDVDQGTRAGFAARGNLMGNQALGSELLNRDQYRRQRLNEAIAQGEGLTSSVQGLQSGALNQTLGVENAETTNWARLINPIYNYASDLFSSNQNAAAEQAVAGANKSGGLAGGAISGIGSIISKVLPIVLSAVSDENLKENIRDTGATTPEGIPIKTFSYRGDKRRFKGVVAQDVEKVRPDAVATLPVTGHKLVALDLLLGAPFEEIKGRRAA